MINRQEELRKSSIHDEVDFSKIRVSGKVLRDAILDLNGYCKIDPRLKMKERILNAIQYARYEELREFSNFFYHTSGIYSRLCRYMAYLYRYDWFLTPIVKSGATVNNEKLVSNFSSILTFLDKFRAKSFFGDVALSVIKNGCYYGYIVRNGENVYIQELPPNFCRVRYHVGNRPCVEFNMRFFVTAFPIEEQRERALALFPPDIKKGYELYKAGKLVGDFYEDGNGWYLLDVENCIKFNLNGDDYPPFITVIPAIIDLDEAQALDKKKMEQDLLKIIIQKMPIDKNGDMIFDTTEMRVLHENAVQMLGRAIGVDVLTTVADVEVAELNDNRAATATDDLERVERSVYNEAGVSQMQFNTDGNLALEKSILNDEAFMLNLILQFEAFLNYLIEPLNKNPKKLDFRVQILGTTIYNYKELAKAYKEHTQIGYSKMLPQIALGQSQSVILATAYFENDVLDLVNVFVPPLSSNVMGAQSLKTVTEERKSGRPEKPDDEKSTKTIQNQESMS